MAEAETRRGGGAFLIAALFALAILILLVVTLLRSRTGESEPAGGGPGTPRAVEGDVPTGIKSK